MKKSWFLSRRTLLRGAGVAIALPFLDQMLPAARGQATAFPRRYVAILFPNGFNMADFTPATEGANYALTPILQGLAPIRSEVTVVSGLQNTVAAVGGNAHLRGFASFLTAQASAGTLEPLVLSNNMTVDQRMAQKLVGQTPFASLELSAGEGNAAQAAAGDCDGTPCIYGNVISWKSPTQPAVGEEDPQAAFDRLFANQPAPSPSSTGTTSTPDPQAEARRALKLSVLDAAAQDTNALLPKLGPTDKAKLDQYLTSLRELEQRLSAASPTGPAPSVDCSARIRPAQAFANDYRGRLKSLMDVAALALQCGLTRVITLVGAGWESEVVFDFLGTSDGHHGPSHHGNGAENLRTLTTIDTWEVEQFAYFAGLLKGMAEGGGTVLDSSLVYMGSDVSDGDKHNYENLPVLLAGRFGGVITPGQHLRVPPTSVGNLHLTALRGFDPQATSVGMSTGALFG